jgi:hypothetical protein
VNLNPGNLADKITNSQHLLPKGPLFQNLTPTVGRLKWNVFFALFAKIGKACWATLDYRIVFSIRGISLNLKWNV